MIPVTIRGRPAESFEFPRGSAIEYLYQGAMWVGAVKGRDTLVSVGADGWYAIHEFFPLPYPEGDIVESNHPKPGVYPNPYRLADDYNASGWEDPTRQGTDPERSRKVTFTNVPSTCTVSIWTLDGDLVRKLDHDANPLS